MKFFYQLKTKTENGDWIDIWTDIGEANSKKELLDSLKNDISPNIAEKITKKNQDKIEYRVFAVELTPHWEEHWCSVRTCKVCKTQYTQIQSRQNNQWSSYDICSLECRNLTRRTEDFGAYAESYSNQSYKPCIYKITNKKTQMVYIGQTVQCFTLRWYQHFFQAGESKFHQAVKASLPSEWSFEVIEVLDTPISKKEVDTREMFWINHHDSINNGYNTAQFKLTEESDK